MKIQIEKDLACKACASTNHKHKGHGLCQACFSNYRYYLRAHSWDVDKFIKYAKNKAKISQ